MKIYAFMFVFGMLAASTTQSSEPKAGALAYFPSGSVSEFDQKWYAKHLHAMREPVLSASGKPAGYFSLRLLYLPTWGRPIAVRYDVNGADAFRRAVMLSGSGGYAPGHIKIDHSSSPTPQQIATVLSSLEESGYWELSESEEVIGADGSQLILETIKDGQHRVLVRWTPEYEPATRNLTKLIAFYTAEFKVDGFWAKLGE